MGNAVVDRVVSAHRTPDLLFEYAETAEVPGLDASVEMQQGVLKDRGMSGREDETVTIGPCRVSRVVLEHAAAENVTEWCERHRRALMAAVRSQRAVHGQPADERNGEGILFSAEGHAKQAS